MVKKKGRRRTRGEVRQMMLAGAESQARESQYHERQIRYPTAYTDVFAVAILGAIFAGLIAYGATASVLRGLMWTGVAGFSLIVWRAWRVFDRASVDVDDITYYPPEFVEEDEVDEASPRQVAIPNPAGGVIRFDEPRPGEFAAWSGDILRQRVDPSIAERDKLSYSQRTALRRGWALEDYLDAMHQLELVGWVHKGANRRRYPTEIGFSMLSAFCATQLPGNRRSSGSGGGVTSGNEPPHPA